MQYIGRFAPSPTGPLHLGSLVAAVASYCDAKAHNGKWLLRIENVDKPRELSRSAEEIIQTLKCYGFEWDDAIIYQDQRSEIYIDYFNRLLKSQRIYPCQCSRKEIADSSQQMGIEGVIYPRTCFFHPIQSKTHHAWRLHIGNAKVSFNDRLAGLIEHDLAHDIGDFVIKRADGLFTYQLAVVADDAEQGVTHVVRGADLLNSTTRQIYLQQCLGLSSPIYMHIPIVTNAAGEKLSKQTLAPALSHHNILPTLHQAFSLLGLHPPKSLLTSNLMTNWRFAINAWKIKHQHI